MSAAEVGRHPAISCHACASVYYEQVVGSMRVPHCDSCVWLQPCLVQATCMGGVCASW